jgi:sec-independent protein translocase protein TatA
MGEIGAPELLIILVLLLVVFGGAQLPKLARSLGQAKKEFTNALSDDKKADDKKADDKPGDTPA